MNPVMKRPATTLSTKPFSSLYSIYVWILHWLAVYFSAMNDGSQSWSQSDYITIRYTGINVLLKRVAETSASRLLNRSSPPYLESLEARFHACDAKCCIANAEDQTVKVNWYTCMLTSNGSDRKSAERRVHIQRSQTTQRRLNWRLARDWYSRDVGGLQKYLRRLRSRLAGCWPQDCRSKYLATHLWSLAIEGIVHS
jgi:hypothetical protein